MRILIFGAGVIGSLYGALMADAGYDVSVYARGKRLETLLQDGLRYKYKGQVRTAPVKVLSEVAQDDCYDFIFLAVRENQLHAALEELRQNASPTIVTMVNSVETYDKWETICGSGRIIPAFPGAGGGFDGRVLDAALTPRLIQPTTLGKTDGKERKLVPVFRRAGIPYQIVPDMHAWQLCHLVLVVPIADAYYRADDPENAGRDAALMRDAAKQIRDNLNALTERGIQLSPKKMQVLRLLPVSLVGYILGFVFRSSFGHRFMYQHSMKAPDEMRRLHEQFYCWLEETLDQDE
ncbi:MAG: ketopantoate reductase family protein [Erysipelotrichaceae bacterium]|nr:ketopantoate reductase family protein [Erysipelotrichaceae bacterium]